MSEDTNTTDVNMESVLRRVRKLMAIAEDGRANANEAAAAARMAESIMRKYQIEHADVIQAELQRGAAESFSSEDCGSTLDPEGNSKTACAWAGVLAVAVANLHDCQARYCWTSQHGKTLRFSGYAADAKMARFTYVYLVQTMAAAGRFYQKSAPRSRAECESFRRGFSSALTGSLKAALRAKREEMEQASASRALVVVKTQAVAEHFGAVKYAKSRGSAGRSGHAFEQGFAEGKRVDVTRRGVESSRAGASSQLAG